MDVCDSPLSSDSPLSPEQTDTNPAFPVALRIASSQSTGTAQTIPRTTTTTTTFLMRKEIPLKIKLEPVTMDTTDQIIHDKLNNGMYIMSPKWQNQKFWYYKRNSKILLSKNLMCTMPAGLVQQTHWLKSQCASVHAFRSQKLICSTWTCNHLAAILGVYVSLNCKLLIKCSTCISYSAFSLASSSVTSWILLLPAL